MFSLSRRMPVAGAPAPAPVTSLPSTVETEVPRSQRPTVVKPAADPPSIAADASAPTPSLTAAIAPLPAAARPRVPLVYVAAGLAVVIAAVIVGVLLGRRGSERPGQPAPPPAVAQVATADAAAPRLTPDAAAPRLTPDAAAPEPPTVDALVAACKSPNEASRLFKEGRAAYDDGTPDRQEYALRVFQSLLRGGHAGFGERAWSAKLAAHILIRRRACGPALVLWRTHQRYEALLARQKGKRVRPPPFPRCP
jgi:hypothetical protein